MRKNTERAFRALLVGTGLCMMIGFASWRVEANHPKPYEEVTESEREISKGMFYTGCTPTVVIKYQPAYTEDELLLMRIASCEAGNQGVEGMAYVMRVVLNRVEDKSFPEGILAVITEPEQFAAIDSHYWHEGYIADGASKALEMIEAGWDETEGAIAFCTHASNAWHSSHLSYIKTFGAHEFYKF